MRKVSARFRIALLLGAGAAPLLAFRQARAAAEYEFRLGHPLTTADAAHVAMTALADGLKKRSAGRIDVTVFPADQLGAQADIGEMVRQGAAVIQLTDARSRPSAGRRTRSRDRARRARRYFREPAWP